MLNNVYFSSKDSMIGYIQNHFSYLGKVTNVKSFITGDYILQFYESDCEVLTEIKISCRTERHNTRTVLVIDSIIL